jgi:hypothetical protein
VSSLRAYKREKYIPIFVVSIDTGMRAVVTKQDILILRACVNGEAEAVRRVEAGREERARDNESMRSKCYEGWMQQKNRRLECGRFTWH